jgi:hypothetical protein
VEYHIETKINTMCVLVDQLQPDWDWKGRYRGRALKVFPMGTERGTTCQMVYQCLSSAPRRISATNSAYSPTAGFRLNLTNSQYELETYYQQKGDVYEISV